MSEKVVDQISKKNLSALRETTCRESGLLWPGEGWESCKREEKEERMERRESKQTFCLSVLAHLDPLLVLATSKRDKKHSR